MIEEEEALTTPVHSFHRRGHWSYQRCCWNLSSQWLGTLASCLSEQSGIESASLICSISDSLPCPGQHWSSSTITALCSQHLQSPPVWLQHEGSRVEKKTRLLQIKQKGWDRGRKERLSTSENCLVNIQWMRLISTIILTLKTIHKVIIQKCLDQTRHFWRILWIWISNVPICLWRKEAALLFINIYNYSLF